jgi:hypothetical protein
MPPPASAEKRADLPARKHLPAGEGKSSPGVGEFTFSVLNGLRGYLLRAGRAGGMAFLVPRITHGKSKPFLTHTACRAWPRCCVAQNGQRPPFLKNIVTPFCTTQQHGSIKTIG